MLIIMFIEKVLLFLKVRRSKFDIFNFVCFIFLKVFIFVIFQVRVWEEVGMVVGRGLEDVYKFLFVK